MLYNKNGFITYSANFDTTTGDFIMADTSVFMVNQGKQKNSLFLRLKKQYMIQLFVLCGIAFVVVFSYIPMFGIIIAFKDYSITAGISGMFTAPWNGFGHFIEFFNDHMFWVVVRNTLAISLLKIIFTFPAPIILAIVLNEITIAPIKRFAQTVSYLPHFISWVIVAGMAGSFFSQTRGVVNEILLYMNIIEDPLPILIESEYFWALAVGTEVWKATGWWSIIFLAAIAGVDPTLYEAAQIDGAGRLKRIWHITLPSIKGAIVVVLVLSIGNLLGGGIGGSNFEQSMLLGNVINRPHSEIIQTYAFRVAMVAGRFDYGAAITFIQSVISVVLIFSSNHIMKRITGSSLF